VFILGIGNDLGISYKWHGFGLKDQMSTLGLGLTAVWRGFELYECFLVLTSVNSLLLILQFSQTKSQTSWFLRELLSLMSCVTACKAYLPVSLYITGSFSWALDLYGEIPFSHCQSLGHGCGCFCLIELKINSNSNIDDDDDDDDDDVGKRQFV